MDVLSAKPQHDDVPMLPFLFVGGLGGTLPTIARLAAYYANHPDPDVPGFGVCLGLALFFVLGVGVTVAFADRNFRQALVVGISAPALISSVNSGTDEARETLKPPPHEGRIVDPSTHAPLEPTSWFGWLSTPAYAENAPKPLAVEAFFGRRHVEIQVASTDALASTAPVQVQFFDEGGYAVGSPLLASVGSESSANRISQPAPVEARGFLVSSAGQRRSILLPSDSFDEAVYRVTLLVRAPSDLKWALGSRREATIEGLNVERLAVAAARPLSEVLRTEGRASVLGVELTHFQKTVDWAALSATGISFAVMRASYGDKPDKKVDDFWATYEAWPERDGMAIGFYHFFRFGQDPRVQAETFLSKARSRRSARSLPPAVALFKNKYDPEILDAAARESYFNQVREFLRIVDDALSVSTLLFLPAESLSEIGLPQDLAQRRLWIKEVGVSQPRTLSEGATYSLWSFGIGLVPGVDTPVALDIFNGDLEAFRQFAKPTGALASSAVR